MPDDALSAIALIEIHFTRIVPYVTSRVGAATIPRYPPKAITASQAKKEPGL
jgi:hypothetical protein